MNKENCEEILMAAMAFFDGEESEISKEEISAHLEGCEGCRREIGEMQNVSVLLARQERSVSEVDLWSAVQPRIEARANWKPFVFLGFLLVVYKLAEMLPERDLGFAFKILPLVFVVALFGFLKENPFKINTELILEK
jgi:predicted anti-sigma-YlaC factor YlaD